MPNESTPGSGRDFKASVDEVVEKSRAVGKAMASTQPKSTGLWFILGGAGLTILGMILSATFIGAICGVPMCIAGIPMLIYGSVRYRQHQLEQLKQSIRDGIIDGAQASRSGRKCSSCGHTNQEGMKFCGGCGAGLSA